LLRMGVILYSSNIDLVAGGFIIAIIRGWRLVHPQKDADRACRAGCGQNEGNFAEHRSAMGISEFMIRSELIQRLAERYPDLRLSEIDNVTDTVFESIVDHLAEGGRVELRGFGAFSVRSRDARNGRNPRTGEAVDVPAKSVLHFKAGKEIRDRLNGG